jgi:hypothetical protein
MHLKHHIELRVVRIAILLLVTAASSARAEDTSKARELYEDGVTNYNLGHFEEALASFESAYRRHHDPAFLFNIGQCQRNLHKYEDAERSYRAYLRESPDLPDSTRLQVQKLMLEMEQAINEQRAKQPPTGTQPPSGVASSETGGSVQGQLGTTPGPEIAKRAPTRQADRPVQRRRWLWPVVIGSVVGVGLAVGLGVGLTQHSTTTYPAPASTPTNGVFQF